LRSGVNRDGQHLYPTFPYDHFSNVTGEDDHALYAYLMSRKPVHARFQSLKVVTADTRLTANEGYTSGSHSVQDSGTAIQNAAAQVRELLLAEAERRLDLRPEALRTEHGAVEPELSELPPGAQQSDDCSHKN
jgi:CO/xanthine dehydrogenase Mo-binding subunit